MASKLSRKQRDQLIAYHTIPITESQPSNQSKQKEKSQKQMRHEQEYGQEHVPKVDETIVNKFLNILDSL